MQDSGPLSGRVVLVTGVSRLRGIGAAVVRRLLADGARVFASGWRPHDEEMPWGADEGGVDALLAGLGGTSDLLHYRAVDLEGPRAAAELVGAALERFGALDILVANHGSGADQRGWLPALGADRGPGPFVAPPRPHVCAEASGARMGLARDNSIAGGRP